MTVPSTVSRMRGLSTKKRRNWVRVTSAGRSPCTLTCSQIQRQQQQQQQQNVGAVATRRVFRKRRKLLPDPEVFLLTAWPRPSIFKMVARPHLTLLKTEHLPGKILYGQGYLGLTKGIVFQLLKDCTPVCGDKTTEN